MNAIIDRIIAIFPEFDEFKSIDIEAQKARVIRDFYYRYLIEFDVDVDNIKRIQVGQQVDGEEEMIPTINFINSINCIIPHNPLGIFDVITPDANFMASKINFALNFFDFCDIVMKDLYRKASPYSDAKDDIKEINMEIEKVKELTKDVSLKTSHKLQMITEKEAECKNEEAALEEIIEKRRSYDQQFMQIQNRNKMLLRQKQMSEAALKTVNEQLESRMSKLNRTIDCEEELNKKEEAFKQIMSDTTKLNSKIDDLKKSNAERTKLRDNLADRLATVKKIREVMLTLKFLEEANKEREIRLKEDRQLTTLEEVEQSIKKHEEESAKVMKTNSFKMQALRNSIERKKYELQAKKDKLAKEKSNFKNIESARKKLKELNDNEAQIIQEYKKNVEKLNEVEGRIARKFTSIANSYKDSSDSILERVNTITKNLKKGENSPQ